VTLNWTIVCIVYILVAYKCISSPEEMKFIIRDSFSFSK